MKKRIVKIISMCLVLASLFTVGVNAAHIANFKDVKFSDWFYPELTYAVETTIINGTSAFTFSPQDNMSRAQFVTILGRAMGASDSITGTKFSDVENGTWFSPYVYWAVEKGIVNGTSATTFSPDDNIHREDMATMIGRMLKAYGYELPADPEAVDSFKDAGSVASYAAESVETLRNAGILKGDTSGLVNPKSDLTRAEGMAVLVRILQVIDSLDANAVPSPSFELPCPESESGTHQYPWGFYSQSPSEENGWVAIVDYTCERCGQTATVQTQLRFSADWAYTEYYHYRVDTNFGGTFIKDVEVHNYDDVWATAQFPSEENGYVMISINHCRDCDYYRSSIEVYNNEG